MINTELFALKTGARKIPVAQTIEPRSVEESGSTENLIELQQLRQNINTERLDPRIAWPGKLKFCGLKEGCWAIEFSPKEFLAPNVKFMQTRYRGTMRIERDGFDHTISADLYKFRKYLYPLERLGIPAKTTFKWNNISTLSNFEKFKRYLPRKCPIYPRNKYHSYLEGTGMLYSLVSYTGKCNYSLNFDQWYYTHPASGFDGDFSNSANRSIRMEISEVTNTHFAGKVYNGNIDIGSITLRWRSKYFRSAHLEIFTLENAEHPPTTVPDGSGGTESFESIFKTAGWKLNVTRNTTKVALPASLAGTSIDQCWALDDLHDLMDSTPGYNNTQLDKKWRVFLVSVPAKLGCSRGVVFDQSTGDTNSIDREGSATFSHDGFNKSHSSNFGVAEDEMMKDWPRGFLRSAAHEVGHAFNQYHQPQQNSIMCPTPSVANAIAASGDTFPDDIDLAFNGIVRHKLIHQPDPAIRPGGMDWATAFGVPEADDVNFYSADDLELQVKANKARVGIGEPIEVSWTLENKMGMPVNVPGSIGPDQHTTRVGISKPNGEVIQMRLPLDAHDASHALQQLSCGKQASSSSMIFWSRNGFAFEQPGRHEVSVILVWEDNDVYFAVESSTEVWVNYPVTERDNEIAAEMMQEDVGRFLLSGNKKRFPKGAECIENLISKHKNHDVCKTVARLSGHKGSKK